MPAQGSTYDGPLLLRGGGLALRDINGGARKCEERFARVTLTLAQLQSMFTTPKVLVPAPGVGKFNEFLGAYLVKPASTAFSTGTTGIRVSYTNNAGVIVSNALTTLGFMDQTTQQMRSLKMSTTDIAPEENAPLVIWNNTADWTGGSGTLILNVSYRIHELT